MAISTQSSSRAHNGSRAPEERQLIASWSERTKQRPLSDEPIVTIIIPVHNNAEYTVRCLQSITSTWFESLQVQIVVVDDASTDGTAELLASLPGIDLIRNAQNIGFIRACNRGAAIARGKYVCFLNNDTVVKDAWLDYLVSTAENDDRIGAVGAKLIYPDGKLQEAGGIIWRDGTGWNYGKGADPHDPRYNYVRDVDYCSGAALLVRRDAFERLSGFSERYAPAYYEDADLCFGIRSLGLRVVYQPRSEVVHYEGATSGRDLSRSVKRYQELNRPKFVDKWSGVLQYHADNSASNVRTAARRLSTGPSILIVDSHVPMRDRDAGSARLFHIIRMLSSKNYRISFLPDNLAQIAPYARELQNEGVEVLYAIDKDTKAADLLDPLISTLDFAWICRPALFLKYEPVVRRNSDTKVIYDTVDLHFIRRQRELALAGSDSTEWKDLELSELSAAARADATVVVTDSEQEVLRQRGIARTFVIPTIHERANEQHAPFEQSTGLIFIGGYNHPPNLDAAKWLCSEIMPKVWATDPTISLTLIGSNPTDAVLSLESDRVRVAGYVPEVAPYFTTARVFVAPLRYGAGMKGKVGHALSFGIPTVATTIAADGFNLSSEHDCLIADTAEDFAAAILRLYQDAALWRRLSHGSYEAIEPFQAASVSSSLLSMLGRIANSAAVASTNRW